MSNSNKPLLKVNNLSVSFDTTEGSFDAVKAVNFDLEKGEIYFIDSCANEPETYGIEIEEFVDTIKEYLKSNGFKEDDIIYKYNTIPHQEGNSECGVYSCNFIIEQLEGKSFDQVVKTVIPDDKMNAMRKEFFNLPSK